MWWMLLFSVVATVVAVYWLLISPHHYWLKRGVEQSNPKFIFGDNLRTTFRKQSYVKMLQMVYTLYPHMRYTGFYQFLTPTLLIKDPDLIKQITVQHFDHFADHKNFVSEESDPLFANNLFALTGQKWRQIRTTFSPAFTSSKMKYMFQLISQNGQQFVNHFLKKNEDVITVEMKATFTKFTNNVVASTAFGVECDSLSDPNDEFYLMGKEITDFTKIWMNLKVFGYIIAPKLFKLLKVRIFSKEVGDFFNRLVKTNIESREKHGIDRPDIVNILMKARRNGLKNEDKEITDQDITSQALLFFFAGYETVSSLMCFMSYELGVNPDLQQKLIQEVDATFKVCNGKLTYEGLLEMKYMDMIVSESLRKWPVNIATDRVCTKPFTIESKYSNENSVNLEEGTILWVPIFAIHRDPHYYSNPDCFDPERFSYENKKKIKPYTYLPFGLGPRNCIGFRFALLATKTLFFYILTEFEIVPVKKTQIPLKISKKQFSLTAEGGFWFGLRRRVTSSQC